MNHEPQRELLSAKDLQEILRISSSSLWRRTNDGTLPRPIKIGGLTRWRRADIEAFISGDAA